MADYKKPTYDTLMDRMNSNWFFRWGTPSTYKEQYDKFFKDIDLDAIVKRTREKGELLSDDELKAYIPEELWGSWRDDAWNDLYEAFVNQNYDTILGKDGQRLENQADVDWAVKAWQQAMGNLGIQNQQLDYTTDGSLNADYQALLSSMNQATDEKYSAAMSELQRAENDMYRTLGMTQRQMERDIAKRRQQALKSGMSTAQLAAQEQQNLLAAQTGATQIAQQYADQRYNTINQFAGARAQNYTNALQSQIGWNQQAQTANQTANNNWAQTVANAYAQLYAADKSYESNKLLNN